MQGNRRNYYRILQVQPEAPIEVIKASWRALMCSAKMHPDLGGDHAQAALINEAFDVLSHPEKRRQYDAQLKAGQARGPAGPASKDNLSPGALAKPACALCGLTITGPLGTDSRCHRCEAPLTPVARPKQAEREPLGRRIGARWPRQEPAELRIGWPTHCLDTRLFDMSMGGLSFQSKKPLPPGSVVRISTRSFDSVVQVVVSRPCASGWRNQARFLTLMRITPLGALLSKQA